MPTAYTHAVQFNSAADEGLAAPNAAYNDLANMTVGLLVRFTGASDATLWSKGDGSTAFNASLVGGDGRVDWRVDRAGGPSVYRGDAITVNNTWRWAFFTIVRATGVHARIIGPKGGTMASTSTTDITGGSGTVNSDAARSFSIGSNQINSTATVLEFAFAGIWNSVLSVAQCQAIADDLSTALQPVAAWKPNGSTTTSIANYIVVEPTPLPAMALTGTTTVVGPDVVTAPIVDSIAPSTGAVGASVTITGSNFTGATAATINGTALTSLVVVNATTITGVVASGTTTGSVVVTTPAGTSTGGPTFTVYTPVYTSLSVNNPNTVYTLGQLLAPITVTKRDQLGNPTSLGPTTVTAAEILPGRSVSGTLTRSFVGPTATFNDLVITEDVVVVPPPPQQTGGLTMVQVVSRPATIPARGAVGSVVCRMISAINGAPAAGVVRVSASMIRVPTGAVLTGTTSKLTDSNGNVTFDDLVLVDA